MKGLVFRRVVLFLLLLAGVAGTVAATQTATTYRVKLDFTNADGLVVNEDVTIGGVKMGKVANLSLRDSVAVVTVEFQDGRYAPLPSGSRAVIRSLGLLGNKYVEIIRGKAGGPSLPPNAELGIESTTSPTDLDQINAIFDAPTREKIRTLTLQGAISLGGRAQVLNRDLQQLRNLALAATPLTGVLDDHQVQLDRATIAFDTFTQKLVREDTSLRGLVEHGSSVLTTIQAHDAQLAGVLAHGDTTFNRLSAILNGNEGNLAGFFARQPTVITSSNYTLDASIPVLRAANPLIPNLNQLLYNMQDSFLGISGDTDPNQLNSNSVYALRALAVVCSTVSGAAGSNSC
jgi:virulence factor Mce-like protein